VLCLYLNRDGVELLDLVRCALIFPYACNREERELAEVIDRAIEGREYAGTKIDDLLVVIEPDEGRACEALDGFGLLSETQDARGLHLISERDFDGQRVFRQAVRRQILLVRNVDRREARMQLGEDLQPLLGFPLAHRPVTRQRPLAMVLFQNEER